MGEGTKIQWATDTFNPWIGCTKVSPGCAHCYAELSTFTRFQRSRGTELWGSGKPRHKTGAEGWKKPLIWAKKAGPRRRVFPSMCDWLDEEVRIDWLADFLKLIWETPEIDWLLLTKRPESFTRVERIYNVMAERYLKDDRGNEGYTETGKKFFSWLAGWVTGVKPPANVWVGTSVEDQRRADERVPQLLAIPAAMRFLSVEPMLGPIDLWKSFPVFTDGEGTSSFDSSALSWVIFGGESGGGARPCNVQWIKDGLQQCLTAGIAAFVKQLGVNVVTSNANLEDWPAETRLVGQGDGFAAGRAMLRHPKGGDMAEWPEELRVREFPSAQSAPLPATEGAA